MMREHLYRGKTESGEWVFGDLIHDCVDAFSKNIQVGIKPKGCYPIEVIAETVGQFTGRTDAENVRIFEGDIDQNAYVVEWHGSGCWGLFKDGIVQSRPIDFSRFRITGNIHEK